MRLILAAFASLVFATGAGAATYTFDLARPSAMYSSYSGQFSGNDMNGDGVISLNELSSFRAMAFSPSFGISGLELKVKTARSFMFYTASSNLRVSIAKRSRIPCVKEMTFSGDPVFGTAPLMVAFGNRAVVTQNLQDSRFVDPFESCEAKDAKPQLLTTFADSFSVSAIPAPAAGFLIASLLGLAFAGRRLRR